MAHNFPEWAETIRRKFRGGESTMFILHGNVFDQVLHDGGDGIEFLPLVDYVRNVLVAETKPQVITIDPSQGVVTNSNATELPSASAGSIAQQAADGSHGFENPGQSPAILRKLHRSDR